MTKANDVTPKVAAAIEVVRSARAALPTAGPRSARTEADYADKYKRLITAAKNLTSSKAPLFTAMAEYAPKSNSWFSMKAAIQAQLQNRIITVLSMQDSEQRRLGYTDGWFAMVDNLDKLLKQLSQIKAFTRADALPLNDTPPKKVKSKRGDLGKLPAGWCERFVRAAIASPKYGHPVALLAATGVRPEELQKGVLLYAEGNQIRVRVGGAKCSVVAGQEFRDFQLNTSLLPEDLCKSISASKDGLRISISSKDALRSHLTRLTRRIFPQLRFNITAYTFRHAVAEALRDSGWTAEEAAAALGHSVAETQALYGRRRSAGRRRASSTSIVRGDVITSRPVRPLDRSFLKTLASNSAPRPTRG